MDNRESGRTGRQVSDTAGHKHPIRLWVHDRW